MSTSISSIPSSDANLFARHESLENTMKTFCEASHVNFDEAKKLIIEGEKVFYEIKNDSVSEGSRESVKALMWYLTALSASKNKHHYSGAIRVQDPKGLFMNYIQDSLKNDPHPAYARISSHMNEYKTAQWGVDFKKYELPAGKKTLLFRHLPESDDGMASTYLKMEAAGCPPFWKKGFRSYKNFATFAHHSINYCKSRCFSKKTKDLIDRHEFVPLELRGRYGKALGQRHKSFLKRVFIWLRPSRLTKEEKVFKKEIKKAIVEGKKYGISRMITHLNKWEAHHYPTKEQKILISTLKAELEIVRSEAHNEGYYSSIKGNEFLVP